MDWETEVSGERWRWCLVV